MIIIYIIRIETRKKSIRINYSNHHALKFLRNNEIFLIYMKRFSIHLLILVTFIES